MSVEGYVKSDSGAIGGIIGHSNSSTLEECYSNCQILGVAPIGGMAGYGGYMKNCYTVGIIQNASTYPGGITGYWGEGTNCYSLTKVASGSSGGPLGGNCSYGNWYTKFTNSYWCAKTSGLTSAFSGTELQYEDLFKKASYENWDFDNIWQIDEGSTTPYLRWMKEPPEEVKKENIDKIQ